MTRYLGIFTVAGAPAGDYDNVRVLFTNTADGAALVAYCTVQESNHFNSDFRIARSRDANDQRQKRLVCYASADCQTADSVNPTQITSTTTKNIHWLFLTPPDFVECHLVSPNLGDLEMRLRVPGDVFTSPVFVPSAPFNADPPYSAGGSTKTSFYIFTGYRNAVNAGTVTRWFIDVSFNEAGTAADLPVNYGIICNRAMASACLGSGRVPPTTSEREYSARKSTHRTFGVRLARRFFRRAFCLHRNSGQLTGRLRDGVEHVVVAIADRVPAPLRERPRAGARAQGRRATGIVQQFHDRRGSRRRRPRPQ